MGEKYDALNQKGRVVVNQVEEKFCFQGEKTYCPAPFFWTDSGFGLYVDTCETTTFHFDENSVTIDLPESAPVVAFSGEPAQIVSAYMELFGKAVLPLNGRSACGFRQIAGIAKKTRSSRSRT